MKEQNFQTFKKKSHNQKIHDAHVLRTQEKEAAKQVIFLVSVIIFLIFYF